MQSSRYSCQILIKLEYSRQIFEKENTHMSNFMTISQFSRQIFENTNIKFHENPSIFLTDFRKNTHISSLMKIRRFSRQIFEKNTHISSLMKIRRFSRQIFEKKDISNFMKIRPVGAEMFHADRRTERHDDANSSFS